MIRPFYRLILIKNKNMNTKKNHKKIFSFLLLFYFIVLKTPVAFAALPGQMNLRNGYQMYVLSVKDENLWAEYEKVFFQGQELLLGEEDLKNISDSLLETKTEKGVNRAYISQFLTENIASKIARTEQGAEISLENDKVVFSKTIQQGENLNVAVSTKIVEEALKNNIDEVELAVNTNLPLLDISSDLQEQGVKEIIAIGESDFSTSSEARIHNIKTAIEKFHGLIVPRGAEFSFNEILGPVNGHTGYKKELVIKGGRAVPEWGGGVCQVSSTLYRAIMLAGLPVLERGNHSYSVSYYTPWGSDATVYPGSYDLKFKNNSQGSLVIHAHIKESKLYFTLIGSKKGLENTDIFGPYITNTIKAPPTQFLPSTTLAPGKKVLISHAHNGFTSTWFRKIGDSHEKIISKYAAIPRVYKVGGLNSVKIGSLD